METGDTPRRRGRPRGFDLEEVTGRAALLFWARGYEGVSVDELTAAMGITTQSFYAAFGSKQKLHREALAWYEREVMRPIRDAPGRRARRRSGDPNGHGGVCARVHPA